MAKIGPTVLPQAVEIEIAQKIKTAADQGFGISRFQLMQKAGQVAKKNETAYTIQKWCAR